MMASYSIGPILLKFEVSAFSKVLNFWMFAWLQSFIHVWDFGENFKFNLLSISKMHDLYSWQVCQTKMLKMHNLYFIYYFSFVLNVDRLSYLILFLGSNCKNIVKTIIFIKIEIFEIVRYFSDQKQTKMGIILSWTLFIIKSYHWCASKNDHKCYNSLPRVTGRVRQECNKVIDMQLFNTQTTKGKKLSFVHSKKTSIPYVVKLSWHGRAIECYHRRSSMQWVWLYYRIMIRLW